MRLVIKHRDERCASAEFLVYFSFLEGTTYTDQLTVVVVVPNVGHAFARAASVVVVEAELALRHGLAVRLVAIGF